MGIISKILSSGAGDLIEQVGNTVDKFVTTGAEKEKMKEEMLKVVNEHEEKIAELGEKELEAYLKDTQSARDANVAIQNSDKASWLSKNVAYMIDLFLTLIWGSITIFIVGKVLKLIDSNVDMTVVLSIYGTVTAVFMTVLNFHRGTSRGSEDKQKTINKMMGK
jgi:hypothetical protein